MLRVLKDAKIHAIVVEPRDRLMRAKARGSTGSKYALSSLLSTALDVPCEFL
jgi:hypothetical protein